MNGTNIVFDTCAVIQLLDRQHNLAAQGIDIESCRFLTSVIVRMELLSKRALSATEERDIREFLSDVVVVPLDDAIEQKANEIRRTTPLKLPDSIVAATSIVLGAVLLTNDEQLLTFSWQGFRAQNIF
ncbi:MAG: type II toxin-antitoxin system VapC family toxin [Treponema sp.]|nr:type II toxin-antitoxin system VapC family toxin [Treponema sp.]